MSSLLDDYVGIYLQFILASGTTAEGEGFLYKDVCSLGVAG